jgi:hypothetical protein
MAGYVNDVRDGGGFDFLQRALLVLLLLLIHTIPLLFSRACHGHSNHTITEFASQVLLLQEDGRDRKGRGSSTTMGRNR